MVRRNRTSCRELRSFSDKAEAIVIPDYQTLMLPVLRLAAEGETRVADVAERIADGLRLTQEERDEPLPSGRQRLLHNRIHWPSFI